MANDVGTASGAMSDSSWTTQTAIARAIAKADGRNYDKLNEEGKTDYNNRAYNAARGVGNIEIKGGSQFRKVTGK